MRKSNKPIWIIILVLCILAILFGAFFILKSMTEQDVNRDAFASTTAPTESTVAETSENGTSAPTAEPTEAEPVTAFDYTLADMGGFDVDFDKLNSINSDVYAWIYIPNTSVDYPVAQGQSMGDDSYYLSHNIYKQYQFSGTIYSELQNSVDFHDRVTVLYGHNMLNGTMFASLHNFEDKTFFDENNTVFILTKDKVLTYLVYSAYTYDDRHILNSFFLSDDSVFESYLDSTLNPHTYNGNVREGVELSTDDRILTLSTCTNGASNTRFLVQGVLVDERSR